MGQEKFKDKYSKFISYNEQNLKNMEMRDYVANMDNRNVIRVQTDIIAEELFNRQQYKTIKHMTDELEKK